MWCVRNEHTFKSQRLYRVNKYRQHHSLLHACQQDGWNTFGMELDPETAGRAATLTGQNIFPNLQAIPDEPQFELISLWHVLEHVYEIDAYFEFFKKRINPGGKLLLALPNSKSFDASDFKEYWAAYDVPRHI